MISTLIDNICKLCQNNGVSFAQLERKLKIGNGSLRKWGKSVPGINKVELVADYFEVSLDSLLERKGYDISDDARKVALQYDSLPNEKKELLRCYISVLKAG